MTRKVRPSTRSRPWTATVHAGGNVPRQRDLGFEPREARGVAGHRLIEELERDLAAALAVIGEPDLGAAAAADPSYQHEPGAEFEPGCQLLHRGSTRAARLPGRRLRVRGGRRRRRRDQPGFFLVELMQQAPPFRVLFFRGARQAQRAALDVDDERRSLGLRSEPEISFSDSAWIFASSRFL